MKRLYLKELFTNPLNSLFICLGFVIAIYSFSIGVSFFKVKYDFFNDFNLFLRNHFIARFQFGSNSTLIGLVDSIEKVDGRVDFSLPSFVVDRGNNKIYYLTGLHEAKLQKDVYPLMAGRYFTEEEVGSDSKIAIVGNKIWDSTYEEQNNRYINIGNDRFKVIGKIGRDTSSLYGIFILVPIKALPKEYLEAKNRSIDIFFENSYLKNVHLLDEIKAYSKDNTINSIDIERPSPKSAASKVYNQESIRIIALIFNIALSFVSIITFSIFWTAGLKRNLAIKRILGATNIDILKIIVLQIFTLTLSSTIISFIIQYLSLSYLNQVFMQVIKFDLFSTITATVFATVIALITSLLIFRNILKFNVLEDVR